jgi:acyl-CoA reductase-like NAD-dependent aldehyde dehydrogenase
MTVQAVAPIEQANSSSPTNAIDCYNPATGEPLGSQPAATPEDVQAALARARVAQGKWCQSSFSQRRAVLTHILEHVLAHADELCEDIVRDSGKTYENAMLGEVMPVCSKITWLIKNGEKYLKPEKVGPGILMHKKARIEYRPLGVVACIIPWNYPLQNIISSLVAPLMAGNAVMIKASEAVAWSSQRFQAITDEALTREGFSPDTVQIINGFADTGAALVRSGVDSILFIGSVENGRRIIEGSAAHLTPVIIEAGGKDPMIICDDAHLDKAVHSALGGSFINLGQNCIASERVIVFEQIYDRFVEEVTRIAGALRQGVPQRGGQVDVGAITSPRQLQLIDALVKDALDKGAKALVGGQISHIGNGSFYPPTVLTDLTQDMDIVTSEVFGPVMLVMKVKDEQEAIALANSTTFGLHSSVITHDRARGERIASQLQAGATCINDFGLCYVNQNLPFGGVKYSGFGCMNGREGLRAYTHQKAVLADRFALEFPPKLFPVGAKDYDTAKSTIHLLFAPRLKTRLIHLVRLLKLSLKKSD